MGTPHQEILTVTAFWSSQCTAAVLRQCHNYSHETWAVILPLKLMDLLINFLYFPAMFVENSLQPLSSTTSTYGASYRHHSLRCPKPAAFGCCLHLPSGLFLDKHRCGPQSNACPGLAHLGIREERIQS